MLTVTFLHATASVYSQTVDLDLKEAKIQQVLREIQKQSDYDFVFKSELLRKQSPITLSMSGVEVTEILDEIIPDHLEYQVIDKTIIIRKKREKPMPDITVQGKVVDDFGDGMPGVTVLVKGTQRGTITDIDGNYSLEVPDGFTVLVFSFVGFASQEVSIDGRNTIDITMLEEATALDEVVVTGFFVMDRESYTGTTTKVSGEEIVNMGGSSLLENLSLIAPSVQTVQNNTFGSNPNATPEIRIRGESVLNTNLSSSSLLGDPNLPLFILDNFPVDIQRIIDLDQTRIESVQVLQDVSATAIYGSRASNGVIIINTRKPEAGTLQATYNLNLDFDFADVDSYDLLSGRELFELQSRLGMRPQTGTAGYETREIERFLGAGVETDWLAQPIRNVVGQRHTLNLQGGTDEIRYSVDGSILSRPGVMKGSGRNTYSAGMSLTYDATDQLTFRNSLETNFNKATESPYGSYDYYARIPGYLPVENLDGSFTQQYRYSVGGAFTRDFSDRNDQSFYNPLFEAQAGNFDRASYVNFINNFEIIWDASEDWRITSNISYQRRNNEDEVFRSPFSIDFIRVQDVEERGTYDYSTTDFRRINANTTITFSRDFNGHVITANAGSTIEETTAQRKGFSTFGYSTNNHDPAFSLGYDIDGFPLSVEETSRLVSMFGTVNYSYKGRYLLDGSYNISGNSSAGASKRFAPFWSLGVGWNLHNEEFSSDIINTLRIMATYGSTGSISFSSYQALTTSRFFADARYLGNTGTTVRAIGNEDLRWQTQVERNLAINFGLFKNRLSGQGAFYIRNTIDVVTTVDAPPSLGFENFTDNLGEIENKGYELSLRGQVMRSSDLDVFLNFTAQGNRERILDIGNAFDSFNENAARAGLTPEQYAEAIENDGEYTITDENGVITVAQVNLATLTQDFIVRFREGGSDDDIYVANSLGIDPMTGQEFFLTPEGEATTDYFSAEIVKAGNTQPDIRGTFGTTVRYKNFNVQAVFTYEYGAQILNETLIEKVENSDKYGNVDRRVLTQGWFGPGDVVPFTSNVTINGNQVNQGFTYPSTRFVQDNNFISFSSLNVSYDAPRSLASRLKMRSLRLSMNMNNIFYASTVRQERGTFYPFSRSITLGIRASF